MNKRKPHKIDIYVGKMIKLGRYNADEMPQKALAKGVGLTFQQIQKYERGANRVSAGRLWDISNVLNLNVQDFYPEQDNEGIDISGLIEKIKLAGALVHDFEKAIKHYKGESK